MSNLAGALHACGTTAAVDDAAYREQQRKAVPTVARNALDAGDCKDLLDMLGLLDVALVLAAKKRRRRVKRPR